jgi:hypothetical protein
VNATLQHALTDSGEPPIRKLPPSVAQLLVAFDDPPRLAAHLRAVHDVAHQLTAWLGGHHPALRFDRDAVLFGAATHDIGKAVHIAELSGPGSEHEAAGQMLLLESGIDPKLARFAATHASWSRDGIDVEDLLVSVADKVWKAKRVTDLEQLLVDRIAAASHQEAWQVFMDLDDHLDRLAAGADHRLQFQNSYPVAKAGGNG